MTTDAGITQLMQERDNMAHQISNREKQIAHLTKRLKGSLTPNQKTLLQAQRTHQVAMLDADRGALDKLETSLADIAPGSNQNENLNPRLFRS